MMNVIWIAIWITGLLILAYNKTSRQITTLVLVGGFLITLLFSPFGWILYSLLLVFLIPTLLLINLPVQRKKYITTPLLQRFQRRLPKMSATEREALEAGTVWWDRELFSGKPNWASLFTIPAPKLTNEEQAFLNGPVETLCRMINEWEIFNKYQDLPPAMWDFLKKQRFFGLIIPTQYGGLGFSAFAHSEILAKIAGCSLTVASTVAVPNSLGPAELLHRYGLPKQKDYYLPRLARGEEIPCFALTNAEAGSDAAAIPDQGVVCRGMFEGSEIIGIRLNWDKRYITLAPVATLLGLAFKLFDPDRLLGDKFADNQNDKPADKQGDKRADKLADKTELGITCALIPTNLPGITIGARHFPLTTPFQNGPTQGKDVFIPLDWIIGGEKMIGHGWRMLTECLSAGRAISLPSSASGASKVLAATSGAYARIRRQFKKPIGYFEGVEEALARMAGNTYLAEAARQTTAACIDRGEAPTVLGAIVKYHLTERYRDITKDAMDIHGGKAIMVGPRNYVSHHYQNSPISITVEGSNILTRCMIIFGQGVFRAHPYLMQEFHMAEQPINDEVVDAFDRIFMQHLSHSLSNLARSFKYGITQFAWSSQYIAALNRASSSFAFISDVCLSIYGGKLKFKEKISGRLSDMLSMMYLATCALKRFQDQGQPIDDKPLLEWVMLDTLSTFWIQTENLIRNLPNPLLRMFLKLVVLPLGKRVHRPSDALGHQVARLLLTPNAARNRLLTGAYLTPDNNKPNGFIEVALSKIINAEQINATPQAKKEAEELRKQIIAVDYFQAKND